MDKMTLLLIMGALLITLILLVLIYVWSERSKKSVENDVLVPETFESLQSVIHHSSSTNSELNNAVNGILEKFIVIGSGSRGIEHYSSLIGKLCLHPHTDSKIILRFEKALRVGNPRFKEEIEKALKLGLAERDKR